MVYNSQKNPFRQKVLARHWPDVERRSDVRTDTNGLERVDLICGGFPCQDLSVAGSRKGLAGERSGLWYEFKRLVRDLRPVWVLIENVPGLISQNAGQDFEIVIEGLTSLDYGVASTPLDSQYFGVPQRRRRIYIVGHLGGPCPPEILFEQESCNRNPPAGGEEEKRPAAQVGVGASFSLRGQGGGRFHDSTADTLIAMPLTTREGYRQDESAETLVVHGRQDPIVSRGISLPLEHGGPPVVAGTVTKDSSTGRSYGSNPIPGNLVYGPSNYAGGRDWHELQQARSVNGDQSNGGGSGIVVAPTLSASGGGTRHTGGQKAEPGFYVVGTEADADGVRAPTGVPGRLDTPDGPRYAALGDAVTVPVIEWIGRRLMAAHRIREGVKT